jgi:putative tricarboxylic transport membrane protein
MFRGFFKGDRVGGIVWFVLGVGLCVGAIRLSLGSLHNPGPGFTPFLSGSLLGIFGLILVCSRSSKEMMPQQETKEVGATPVSENRKRLIWTIFTLLVYILLFEALGFLLSTFLFFVSLFKLTNPGGWRAPLMLSAGSVVATYIVFSIWLKCQLPAGILAF